MRKHKGIKELIEIEWKEIDRCITNLNNPKITDKYKVIWSRLLTKHVERLDKLLWKAGLGKLEEESLAKLLEKVPLQYRNIVLGKVRKHEKTRKTKET